MEKITLELKQILKKDFNKKMVENTAFKKFEMWWEEESTKEDKSVKREDQAPAKEPQSKENNLNILLEANRENLYSNTSLEMGLGLGLRASLPKMPSFRRKKMPSPVPEDDDSRKLSDSEEIVQNSDSESRSRDLRRIRKVSSSSSSSESSVFSSSSESSSSEESSSDSEDEEVKEVTRKEDTPVTVTRERTISGARESTTPERKDEKPEVIDDALSVNDGILPSNKTPEPMQVDTDGEDSRPRLLSESTMEEMPAKKINEKYVLNLLYSLSSYKYPEIIVFNIFFFCLFSIYMLIHYLFINYH